MKLRKKSTDARANVDLLLPLEIVMWSKERFEQMNTTVCKATNIANHRGRRKLLDPE